MLRLTLRAFCAHGSAAQVLVLGIAVAVASPAAADWRYTSWRMTPADVVEASEGQAEVLDEPEGTASELVMRVAGSYRTGPFEFEVSFLFKPGEDGVLDRVALALKNGETGSQLYQSLVSTYGEPETESIKAIAAGESHTATWSDEAANNLVTYVGIGDYYAIEYAPLNRADDGL